MNYLYLNNPPVPQPLPRTFVFNKRNEKIDWRRIAAVDVERVARELDFQTLQDNIEQIALCNIDVEVDSRAMDPNYLKLYKMAQLIIEYLLLCQDQITNQLVDYDQLKGRSLFDHEEARRQIEKLKNDLNETKKESKKRKKLIETQQKMLMAQQTTHHTCPVCSHSFLSLDYLQAHIHRRHPEYQFDRRREHDVDMEKENQRLKTELQSKDTELQMIKVQKAVDEEKLKEREETIRQLKEEIQSLNSKIAILDEKYFTLRSSTQTRTPSPHRREAGVKELLKENKTLRAENEQLRQSLQQAEANLKQEHKAKRRLEREINTLKETLRSLQNASGDTSRLSEESIAYRNRYNEEKNRRKRLQEELDEANRQLAEFRNQPPPVIDRKSPAPPPRSSATPSPPPIAPTPAPTRPIQRTEIFLPQYCPSLVRQINENPRFLNRFRNDSKTAFIEELDQEGNLGINEKDTRLPTNVFQTKMNTVEETRRNIQNDLPNFERIRTELSRTLDKLAHERMNEQHASGTSARLSGGKLVTFEDRSQHQTTTTTPKKTSTTVTTIQSKSKSSYNHGTMNVASDAEKTNTDTGDSDDDDRYTAPTKPAAIREIQPAPRKPPTTAVSALAAGSMRPTVVTNTKIVSTPVRPQTSIKKHASESDSDSDSGAANVATKTRNLDQRLTEISSKGQKPTSNAIPQGFQPSRTALATRNDDNDDKSDSSFTSVNEVSHVRKPAVSAIAQGFQPSRKTLGVQSDDDDDESVSHVRKPSTNQPPHISGRDVANNHQHFSSGDVSQYTYDSLIKSPAGKGADFRRPATADSAKTSNVDSDDNFGEDDSN